jgi:hypothetical protein
VLGTPAVLLGVGGVTLAQLLFTYAPFMNTIFHSRALTLQEGAVVIGVGVAMLLIVEIEKRIRRAFVSRRVN